MSSTMDSIRFNFLYAGHYIFSYIWQTPRSYVPYSMARYITEGEGKIEIDQKVFDVKKGDIIYIPQGSLLYCESSCQTFSFISIRFSTFATINDNDFLSEYYHVQNLFTNETFSAKSLFDEIVHHSLSQSPYKNFSIQGNLELLIAFLIKNSQQKLPVPEITSPVPTVEKNIKHMDHRIQMVIDYLVFHSHEKFSSEFLCDLADLSPSSFRRLFKEQTGKTPGKFIMELKLLSASKLLIESHLEINQIAYTVGFESSNYFIRSFKKNYGVTPSQFREIISK